MEASQSTSSDNEITPQTTEDSVTLSDDPEIIPPTEQQEAADSGIPHESTSEEAQSPLSPSPTGAEESIETTDSSQNPPEITNPTNPFGGGLRSIINQQRPKARQYSYPTEADSETLAEEIDEFYSYVEAPQVVENRAAWEEWCTLAAKGEGMPNSKIKDGFRSDGSGDAGALGLGLEESFNALRERAETDGSHIGQWTNLPTSSRRRRIQALLTLLEVKDAVVRQRASRALLYLLQGSFADTKGAEHQLSWVTENARMVRAAGGLGDIYNAFKIASWKHDWLSALPDFIPSTEAAKDGEPAPEPLLTVQAKLEYLDEINLELALHFAQLYILLETQESEDGWGDEVMSLDPPLPIYLFSLVAALRGKNAKGYPVKKLLLLLWKSILASFGGLKDAARCKEIAREVEGLPRTKGTRNTRAGKSRALKTTPADLMAYQDEIVVKYPTYMPVKRGPGDLPADKIASATLPIPTRKMTGPGDAEGMPGGNIAFPVTPAPSPPPSPKPNKQKYQTDQTRPFIFPYSRSVQGPRTVPYSIAEASRLYQENVHVSLESWQMWRLREECIQEESGVGTSANGTQKRLERETKRSNGHKSEMMETYSQGSRSPTSTDMPSSQSASAKSSLPQAARNRGEPTLERLQALEKEIEAELIRVENDHMLAVLDNDKFISTLSTLQEKKEDCKRLQRVEVVYQQALPYLQDGIIVLLKLLLATMTQQNTSSTSPHFQALADGVPIEEAPPPTLEDIDIVRHREITSKAISGTILLLLKWFKYSHTMKFNYLTQLLVDSNYFLLSLKLFGLTELSTQVKVINEIPNFNFFKFCELNCGSVPRKPNPEDAVLAKQPFEGRENPPAGLAHLNSFVEEGSIEYMDRYSFRNFFSYLNFTRILQMTMRKRTHRVLMMIQYKSSALIKRLLKVPHPDLQLYALKIIKSQVPFLGRKWRQANMKVITAIYLNCRPNLRDEWLSGADVDGDVEDSLPQEQALRSLVRYYNATRVENYHGKMAAASEGKGLNDVPSGGPLHKRTPSAGLAASPSDGLPSLQSTVAQGMMPILSPGAHSREAGSFFEGNVLPPLRRTTNETAGRMRYIPDDLLEGYLDDYEDVLGEVFGENRSGEMTGGQSPSVAWARLGEILGQTDSISDTESISTIGDLHIRDDDDEEGGGEGEGINMQASGRDKGEDDDLTDNDGAQTWESLSPQAMRYLTSNPRPTTPGSPRLDRHTRRRSSENGDENAVGGANDASKRKNSSSSPLRPVLTFGPELLENDQYADEATLLGSEAHLEQYAQAIEDEEEPEPLPKPKAGGIDEVEHIWNL